MEDDFDGFLNVGDVKTTDAKFNIFGFQHHLLAWIFDSSNKFSQKDYDGAFNSLTNLYTDACPFFKKDEIDEVDPLFDKALKANIEYVIAKQNTNNRADPTKIYYAIIALRKIIMKYMARHQLLIQQIKKGDTGAGSQY